MGLTKNSTGMKLLSSDKEKINIKEDYVVALAGNPNVGKSTVFNELTGLNQHTGNWPGKTVENAEGYYEFNGSIVKVVDLPGTYSLLSNSEEEEIARDYICFSKPDVVVVVADATSLERNLNLFIQISEITYKVLLCVNLIDEAKKKNIEIDFNLLEDELNSIVVPASARSGIGINDLKKAILKELKSNKEKKHAITYSSYIEESVKKVENIINKAIELDKRKSRWLSIRILEGNKNILDSLYSKYDIKEKYIKAIDDIKPGIKNIEANKSIEDQIVESIIKKAENISNRVVNSNEEYNKTQRKIDKILVSKKTGIPIMILTLLIILWITITLANYPSDLLARLFGMGEDFLRDVFGKVNLPSWVGGLIIDGVYTT